MILFEKIRFKNLLSYGNVWTEFRLDKSPTTLIHGKMGHGKSSIQEAICFSLFGKPFRKLKKLNKLINFKNGRELLTEIYFSVNDVDYIVKRGLKPEIFEIWQGDVLINQNASKKDYQEVLENDILQFDYITFNQIVLLGKATYVCFMKLNSAEKRSFVESMLKLNIFGSMNEIHKSKVIKLKEDLTTVKNDVILVKEKINIHEKYIERMKKEEVTQHKEYLKKLKDQLKSISDEVELYRNDISNLQQQKNVVDTQKISELNSNIKKFNSLKLKAEMKFQQLQNSNKFFNDNTTCPTCSQEINDDFRVEKINSIVEKTNLVDLAISDIQGKLDKIINDLNIINDIINENNNIDKKIDILNSQINERNRQRKALKEQIEAKKDIDTNRIQNELDNLRVMEDEYSNVLDKKNELLEVYEYYELVSSLLKDSGIKQTIIRKYIPLINNLVNDYLSKLGFYVRFHLDEDFNETIYARGIEELSYANFSEGEKQRIDIAILLAWRDIAKMQNEMNTNLLFFDEILDGSADSEGAEYIVDLLTTMENTNVFVISHSVDKWLDKCRSVINISRENGYSVITSG